MLKKVSLLTFCLVFLLWGGARGEEVVIHDFEEYRNMRVEQANGGVLEFFDITSENAVEGEACAVLGFDLTTPDQTWSEVQIIVDCPTPLNIEGFKKVKLWVYGDVVPHNVIILFWDGFLECSVYGQVDWEGWREWVIDIDETVNKWNVENVRLDRIERVRIVVSDSGGVYKTKGQLLFDRLAVAFE